MRTLVVLVVVAIWIALALVWLLYGDNAEVSAGTMVIAVLSVVVAIPVVLDFFRGRSVGTDAEPDADEVCAQLAGAVREQWESEAKIRDLADPHPLAVCWTEASQAVMDWPDVIIPSPLAHSPPSALSLKGGIDEVVEQFIGLPRHRLVVIGQPGAGKTTVLLLLTLGLLQRCRPNDSVPVLVTLATWDPLRQPHVSQWLAAHMAQEYPFLRKSVEALISDGRVLPILDGLDELPTAARAEALKSINRLGVRQPLVVACRSKEFTEAIHEGDVLTGAAVVELQPIPPEVAVEYLRTTTPPDRAARWNPVFARLSESNQNSLATALSTPLMLTLARSIYALDWTADPGELVDETRCPTREAVEGYLLDELVPSAYRPGNDLANRRRRRWNAAQAQRWLTYLALHLSNRRTSDLMWWNLSPLGRFDRIGAGLIGGLAAGLAVGVVGGVFGGLVGGVTGSIAVIAAAGATGHPLQIGSVEWFGLAFAAVSASLSAVLSALVGVVGVWAPLFDEDTVRRGPGWLGRAVRRFAWPCLRPLQHIRRQDGWTGRVEQRYERIRQRFNHKPARQSGPARVMLRFDGMTLRSLGRGIGGGMTVGIASGLANGIMLGYTVGQAIVWGLALGGGLGFGCGLVVGLLRGAVRDSERPLTPASSLRADQTAAGVTIVGVALGAGLSVGFSLGTVAWMGAMFGFEGLRAALTIVLGIGVGIGIPGAIVFSIAAATAGQGHRPCLQYQVSRTLLAARGQLPWRLMVFLEDAYQMGILRQVGAVYQFRHVRLQDRLAGNNSPNISRRR